MASNNLGGQQFKASIAKWKAKLGDKLDKLARQSIFEMSGRVVAGTPVDTGFLRGSWQPSIGEPQAGKGKLDKSGAGAMSEITLTVNGMKAGQKFYLINNAAYARRIEYGFVGTDKLGRKYDQPGRFFITDNVKRWPLIVDRVAKELL